MKWWTKLWSRLWPKKRYNVVPMGWDKIPIGKWKEIVKVVNDDDSVIKVISIVYDLPYDNVLQMTLEELQMYARGVSFVWQGKPKRRMAKMKYVLNGHHYKTCLDFTELTTAQYIDFQQMAPESGEYPADFLSVLLVPEGHKYNDGYNIAQVRNDIRNFMTVEEALGLADFFTFWFQRLTKRLMGQYSRMKKRMGKPPMTQEQERAMKTMEELLRYMYGLNV